MGSSGVIGYDKSTICTGLSNISSCRQNLQYSKVSRQEANWPTEERVPRSRGIEYPAVAGYTNTRALRDESRAEAGGSRKLKRLRRDVPIGN